MDTPGKDAEHEALPLELVEFELTLNAQDLVADGFEEAVRRAAESSSATVLFHMPAGEVPDCQRIAAVGIGDGEEGTTALVLLGADGRSLRVENAAENDNPFAAIALSYRSVMDRLETLAA